jgi:hypothetical protein
MHFKPSSSRRIQLNGNRMMNCGPELRFVFLILKNCGKNPLFPHSTIQRWKLLFEIEQRLFRIERFPS